MYYKMKSMSVRNGKVWVTVAASNCFPTKYDRVEYAENEPTVAAKLARLALSLWDGNIQPNLSCNHRDWTSKCQDAAVLYGIRHTSWELDRDYCLERESELKQLVVQKVLVPAFYGIDPPESILDEIREFDDASLAAYRTVQAGYDKQGVIVAQAAFTCAYHDAVLIMAKDGKVWMADRDRYDNRRHLDNSDGKAVDVTEFWRVMAYGHVEHWSPASPEQAGEQFRNIPIPWEKTKNFPLKRLPYPGFDYKAYGLIFEGNDN